MCSRLQSLPVSQSSVKSGAISSSTPMSLAEGGQLARGVRIMLEKVADSAR